MNEKDKDTDDKDNTLEIEMNFGPFHFKGKGKHEEISQYTGDFYETVKSLSSYVPIIVEGNSRDQSELLLDEVVDSHRTRKQSNPNSISEFSEDSSPISRFAAMLGISEDYVRGALDPSPESPYIYLEKTNWASFRSSLPERGPGAIAKILLPATALVLWSEYIDLKEISTSMCGDILVAVGEDRDTNIPKNIGNCDWLRLRNGNVSINPSKRQKGINLVKAFCLEETFDR